LFKFGRKFLGRFADNRKVLFVAYNFSAEPPGTHGSHCLDGFFSWRRGNSEFEGISFFIDYPPF
jgi:hypothetical protein